MRKGTHRALQPPGTHWEYNDVRVNRLALALLRCWRRPLPDVLREAVMDPIGASGTWEWHGYRNSYVAIDGTRMQSVSGGGHWGGGLWISSRDHARFGYLHLRRGAWEGRRLLSERWIDLATTPCAVTPVYGCLWWLNTERRHLPGAPASSFFALGAGQNAVWIDPDHDVVAVVRWIAPDALDGFIQRVLAAVR
jgi:CubicO group peptidase (beta-lactamase class C family)